MPIDQATFDRLKGLFIEAGGLAGRADLAAAVAFAESAGCQYALAGPVDIRPVKRCTWHRTDGENSCGYWQINLRAHPNYDAPSIFGELENAQAAVEISNRGDDFAHWTTYTNGAYRPYLAQYGGGTPTTPLEPPPPKRPAAGAGAVKTSWASGWRHFQTSLARELPASLQTSRRYRAATLQQLQRARKVG